MKIFVDASVFTEESGSYGRISGFLEVAECPPVGGSIDLSSRIGAVQPRGSVPQFKVASWIRSTATAKSAPLLELEDLCVETDDQARELIAYLEAAFSLVGEVY